MKLLLLFLITIIFSTQMLAFNEHSCDENTKEASHAMESANSHDTKHPAESEGDDCDCPNCICQFSQVSFFQLVNLRFEYISYLSSQTSFYYLPFTSSSFLEDQIKPPIS